MSEIIGLGMQIHAVFKEFLAIDGDVHKISLRRILPIPGFFETADFKSQHRRLSELHIELLSLKNELQKKRGQIHSSDEETVFNLLCSYSDTLVEVISKLRDICGQLAIKSTNSLKYQWGKYRKDHVSYDSMVDHLGEIGNQLTPLFRRLDKGGVTKRTSSNPADPNELYFTLLAAGAGLVVASRVVADRNLISEYWMLKEKGWSDLQLAGYFNQKLGESPPEGGQERH